MTSSDKTGDSRRTRVAAVFAGSVGNILEWYDFSIFAFLIPIISPLFFPSSSEASSVVIAFGALGIIGFVARPIGSIVFGVYGDRYGRRASLAAISILMGLSTLAMGLLPTTQAIGGWAAVALVVARLLQGISAGGEYGGAIPFLVEFAERKKRGLTGSSQQFGNGIGLLLGSLFAYALTTSLSADAMKEWGWRIPFIVGAIPALVGLYLRLKLPDTPVFVEIERTAQTTANPLRLAFTENLRETLTIFGLSLHLTVGAYIVLLFMPTYLGMVTKLSKSDGLLIVSAGLFTYAFGCVAAGAISDRIGRKPLILLSSGACAVLFVPLLALASSGSFSFALVSELVLAALIALAGGPFAAACAEASTARVRASTIAIGVGFAVTIFGGFAPFLSAYLISKFGNPLAPGFYGVAAAAITFVICWRMRETAFDQSIATSGEPLGSGLSIVKAPSATPLAASSEL